MKTDRLDGDRLLAKLIRRHAAGACCAYRASKRKMPGICTGSLSA
jgi:hypothetical protein